MKESLSVQDVEDFRLPVRELAAMMLTVTSGGKTAVSAAFTGGVVDESHGVVGKDQP